MDILNIRTLIDRFEECETILETEYETERAKVEDVDTEADDLPTFMSFDEWVRVEAEQGNGSGEAEEYLKLRELLDDLKGSGGDHQWHSDWYPATLIAESDFEDYAQELAEDIGAISPDASWPNNCIDWTKAANELRQDYSEVDYDGMTYLYR